MKAAEARKATAAWHRKVQREHDAEYKATMSREKKHAAAVWEERGDALVAKIDKWIAKAASEGHNGTYEPSNLNPNGDEVIWLEDKRDWPIHELLMEHYRGEGYEVEEYQNHGMKITW
jgi:hypothetical protein